MSMKWRVATGSNNAMCLRLRISSPFSSYVSNARLLQELKENNEKCEQYLQNGHFVLYHKGKPLVNYKEETESGKASSYTLLQLDYSSLLPYYEDPGFLLGNSVLLGLTATSQLTWALLIPSSPDKIANCIEENTGGMFMDMRAAIFLLPVEESSLVSQGNALLYWHRHFKFCNRCGHATRRNVSGSLISCTSCSHQYYPQISPVIITVISNAAYTKCLLVRQPRHMKGMYTAVAGYVEAGESLEECVKREIAEEIGLEVIRLEYLMSQHWPLPTSTLMLGCLAIVDDNEQIIIDTKELEDARWFFNSDVKQAVEYVDRTPFPGLTNEKGAPFIFIPPKGAVAHDLIKY